MAKSKAGSPFVGRWHIVSMSMWNESDFNVEAQAFIESAAEHRLGEFQFGYVQGDIDDR